MTRATLTALALGVALLGAPGVAHAAPDVSHRVDEATTLFKSGDFAGAADVFKDVYAATGETRYLWNMALAEYKAGRAFDALEHLRAYVAKPDANADYVTGARRLIAELMAKVGRLLIVAPAGAEVLVNGTNVGDAPLGSPIDVEPSKPHVVTIRRGDETMHADLEPTGTNDVRVELHFAVPVTASPAPPAASAPRAPAPRTAPAVAHVPSHTRTWVTVGLSVAAIGSLGAAIGLGVASSNDHDEANDLRATSTSSCLGSSSASCAELRNAVNGMGTDHTLSQVFYGAAGVFAAGAVASWIFLPKEQAAVEHVGVTPLVGPHSVGATFTRTF